MAWQAAGDMAEFVAAASRSGRRPASPVSDSSYQRTGYRAAGDRVAVEFTAD